MAIDVGFPPPRYALESDYEDGKRILNSDIPASRAEEPVRIRSIPDERPRTGEKGDLPERLGRYFVSSKHESEGAGGVFKHI